MFLCVVFSVLSGRLVLSGEAREELGWLVETAISAFCSWLGTKSNIASENTAAMAESNLYSFCSAVASVLLLKGLVVWKSLMVALVSGRSMATKCNILASTACVASTIRPTKTTTKIFFIYIIFFGFSLLPSPHKTSGM